MLVEVTVLDNPNKDLKSSFCYFVVSLAICDLLIRLVVDPLSVASSIAVTAIQLESLSYSSSDSYSVSCISYSVVQELKLIRFYPFSLPRFPCSFHSQSGSFDYESILGHNLSYILQNYAQFKACGSWQQESGLSTLPLLSRIF